MKEGLDKGNGGVFVEVEIKFTLVGIWFIVNNALVKSGCASTDSGTNLAIFEKIWIHAIPCIYNSIKTYQYFATFIIFLI